MHHGHWMQMTIGNLQPFHRVNDGQENPEWIYLIEWNDAKYQADNTIGWEATRSNDEAEIKTKYNWNGTTWTSE